MSRNNKKTPPKKHKAAQSSKKNTADKLLPPPHILQEYEYASEGTVERLLLMAEEEQRHRHRVERFVASSYRLGQFFALCTIMAVITGATFVILGGHDSTGLALAIMGFITFILSAGISHMTFGTASRARYHKKKRSRAAPKK